MTEPHKSAPPPDVVPGHPRLRDGQGRDRLDDQVPVAQATAADLRRYDEANRQLGQMQVPVLVSRNRPDERLFVAVLDGTGNDMRDPSKGPTTGVAQIHQEIDRQRAAGLTNVFSGYVNGPGTGAYSNWSTDGAQGHTFEERAESMYRQFIEKSAEWLKQDPKADIRVAALGFSRGAEEAAYFTRLVDQRGIQDPTGAVYTTGHDGLVESVRYTRPPLVAPGHVRQAAMLDDPVATGDPRNYDRRLPPSVVSALQITARDETRDQFIGTQHLPSGFSDGQRSLNVTVPGAHSDIGDGYPANGLGTRNTNMARQYLNGLVDNDKPLLALRPEAQGQHPNNVIHDSERHHPWLYTRMGFDRDGVRDVNTQLAAPRYEATPEGGAYQVPPTAEEQRRQPIDPKLSQGLDYRPLPMAPVPVQPDRAALPTPTAPTVADNTHPGNPVYLQALQGLRNAPTPGLGQLTEEQQSRAAAALTAVAAEGRDPLRRIDAVMLNRQGDALIALEGAAGDPANRLRSIPLAEALNTPVQDATRRIDAALQDPARAPAMVAQPDAPQRAAAHAR